MSFSTCWYIFLKSVNISSIVVGCEAVSGGVDDRVDLVTHAYVEYSVCFDLGALGQYLYETTQFILVHVLSGALYASGSRGTSFLRVFEPLAAGSTALFWFFAVVP